MSQRFTEAELAAEWWKAAYMATRLHRDNDERHRTEMQREETFHRFAQLPHAHTEGEPICGCGHEKLQHSYITGQCDTTPCACPMFSQ